MQWPVRTSKHIQRNTLACQGPHGRTSNAHAEAISSIEAQSGVQSAWPTSLGHGLQQFTAIARHTKSETSASESNSNAYAKARFEGNASRQWRSGPTHRISSKSSSDCKRQVIARSGSSETSSFMDQATLAMARSGSRDEKARSWS